jgi:hypothetical protein
MTKCPLSKADLEHAALVELRTHDVCEGIKGVGIEYFEDVRHDTNWRIATLVRTTGSIASASQQELRVTAQAIQAAERKLRELYSLRSH